MDRTHKISLVSQTYTKDAIGQYVPTESTKEVYCEVRSITQTEYYKAGQNGLKPEYSFVMNEFDYSGQEEIIYNGEHYGVYRTYRGKNDSIELYATLKGGVTNGN